VFPLLLQTFKDLEAMHAEFARIHTLSKLFDCSELLEQTGATIKATDSELQALSALWTLAATSEARLAQWNQTVRAKAACLPELLPERLLPGWLLLAS
jgi:hypothetical protein